MRCLREGSIKKGRAASSLSSRQIRMTKGNLPAGDAGNKKEVMYEERTHAWADRLLCLSARNQPCGNVLHRHPGRVHQYAPGHVQHEAGRDRRHNG